MVNKIWADLALLVGGFSSVVALQLNKLETWLSPVTLLLGDKDIWMVLVT